MATSNVIEEFLVAVGFKLDEAGLVRLRTAVAGTETAAKSLTKELGAVSLASVGMATAIGAAVLKVNDNLSHLYYMSQRTYVSAQNLKEFSTAVKQIGLSSQGVTGQIDGFARAMRDNPMLASYFGARTGGTNPQEIMMRLAEQYRSIIQQFGDLSIQAATFRASISQFFDPEQIRQMALNLDHLKASMATISETYKRLGLDINSAVIPAVQASRDWQTVLAHIGAIWDSVVIRGTPLLIRGLEDIETWLGKHDQDIERVASNWSRWIRDEGIDAFHQKLVSVGTAIDKIIGALQWMNDHPGVMGAASGALVGGRIAGAPGAVVGGFVGMAIGQEAGATPAQQAWGQALHDWNRDHSLGRDRRDFAHFKEDFFRSHPDIPRFARGGIVPIGAHAGEMILPQPISEGLQAFFGSGNGGVLREFHQWFVGSTGIRPYVQVAGLDRLLTLFEGMAGGTGAGSGVSGTGGGATASMPHVGFAGRMPGAARPPTEGGGSLGDTRSGGSKSVLDPPNVLNMTPEEREKLGLIMQYESRGGHNVMNFEGLRQGISPTAARGYTAQGYYQMLNSNWRNIAPRFGITTPSAMSSSFEDQTKVALTLLREGGIGNWSHWNSWLAGALKRGERPKFGAEQNVGAEQNDFGGGSAAADAAKKYVYNNSISQEANQRAAIAAGARPPFPSTVRFNARGEAFSGDPGTQEEHARALYMDKYIRSHRGTWLTGPAPSLPTGVTKPHVTIHQHNTTTINGAGDGAGRLNRHNTRTQAQLLRSTQRLLG